MKWPSRLELQWHECPWKIWGSSTWKVVITRAKVIIIAELESSQLIRFGRPIHLLEVETPILSSKRQSGGNHYHYHRESIAIERSRARVAIIISSSSCRRTMTSAWKLKSVLPNPSEVDPWMVVPLPTRWTFDTSIKEEDHHHPQSNPCQCQCHPEEPWDHPASDPPQIYPPTPPRARTAVDPGLQNYSQTLIQTLIHIHAIIIQYQNVPWHPTRPSSRHRSIPTYASWSSGNRLNIVSSRWIVYMIRWNTNVHKNKNTTWTTTWTTTWAWEAHPEEEVVVVYQESTL